MRVLVLDDDRAFLNMLAWALREAGHDVASATNGAAGLDLIGDWTPDAVVLDVRMPGMDGKTFVRRYRALTDRPAPIVVLSAFEDARARIRDADAYVRKPFELDDLISLLADIGPKPIPTVQA
jgi:DNA-binding response OmpR family regulator